MTPTDLVYDGHTTRLKWHRGRRRPGDRPFTPARIVEGLALGAGVEIDVRIARGGVPTVRHDRYRWWDAPATPLASVIRQAVDVAPTAELQLDIKDPARTLTPWAAQAVATAVGPVADVVTVSGTDPVAVAAIGAVDPRLRTGHDPCTRRAVRRLHRSGDVAAFLADALGAQPTAVMIYLDHRLILALADRGHDIVADLHTAGKRVDAYTLTTADPDGVRTARRLLELRVDQITTDDADGLAAALR